MSNDAPSSSLNSERVERLLAHLWERRGTDLLLTVGTPPLVRVDGELFPVPSEEILTRADTEQRPDSVPLPRLLDACVDLWTARRIAARALSRPPENPGWNEDGLRMELVC